MKKLAKKILHIAEFLLTALLFTLEIGCSTYMANMVMDCINCFFAYPNVMSFLQLLCTLFMASLCGVATFLSLIFILMVTGQV